MIRVIHISDLHMHRDPLNPDNRNAWAIAHHLISQYGQDQIETHVVITGDCIDDGLENQLRHFSALRLALKQAFYLHISPGNHDDAMVGNYFVKESAIRFRKEIGISSFPRIDHSDTEGITFIGLDSSDPKDMQPLAEGIIGDGQRGLLSNMLHNFDNVQGPIVVYMHHHPFYRVPGCILADSTELMRLLSGNVDLVLFGHAHISDAYFKQFGIPVMLASGKSTAPRGNVLSYRIVLFENKKIKGVYTEEIEAKVEESK